MELDSLKSADTEPTAELERVRQNIEKLLSAPAAPVKTHSAAIAAAAGGGATGVWE